MHTHRHRYHFWLIGLKSQWGYLIKKQVCLWTHFRQSKCSTTTYPYYPNHHPPQLPSTTPKPTINSGIERSLFILQPYTYSKTSHFPSYLININSDFFQTFTTGFYFTRWSKYGVTTLYLHQNLTFSFVSHQHQLWFLSNLHNRVYFAWWSK